MAAIPVDVQAAAQADADRFFGDMPARPWPAGDDGPARSRWPWVLSAAALLILAAAAWASTQYIDDLTTPRDKYDMPPPRETASLTGDPDEDLVDEPAPAPKPASPSPVQPGSTQFSVSRQRREWHIEAHGASRLRVAQALAEATGSSLRGDLSLLNAAWPLDLRWQGHRAAQAWQAVLGQELSFLTQCSGSRCSVWLLQAGDTTDTTFRLAPPRPVIPVPSAATSELAPMPAAQPSDSADPRVAAHHD